MILASPRDLPSGIRLSIFPEVGFYCCIVTFLDGRYDIVGQDKERDEKAMTQNSSWNTCAVSFEHRRYRREFSEYLVEQHLSCHG